MSQVTLSQSSNSLTQNLEEKFGWSPSQVETFKSTFCKGLTNDEVQLFGYTAARIKLDPFARQIYPVKRWDSKQKKEVLSIQYAIDGFRVIAERTGQYFAGQELWCGADGVWLDVWLEKTPPKAAKVSVVRCVNGVKHESWAVALFDEYVGKDKDGKPTKFWRDMAALMIAKVAEAKALRKAFPQDLSGMYTTDEMAQADNGYQAPEPKSELPTDPPPRSEVILNQAQSAEPIEAEYQIETDPEAAAAPSNEFDKALRFMTHLQNNATSQTIKDVAMGWAADNGYGPNNKLTSDPLMAGAYTAMQRFKTDFGCDQVPVGEFLYTCISNGSTVAFAIRKI